jgi:arylsulfatase A-like enzyme
VESSLVAERAGAKALTFQRPATYFYLAVWVGLATGLLEAAGQVFRRFYLREAVRLGHEVIWMAPLANVVLFALIGLALYLLAKRWPHRMTLRLGLMILGAMAFYTLFSLSDKLAPYAKWLLAIGLATQLGALVTRYPKGFFAVVRFLTLSFGAPKRSEASGEGSRSAPPLDYLLNRRQIVLTTGATVAGLALGLSTLHQVRERKVLAALPRAKAGLPNVLLIVMDTARAKSMSFLGYERSTTPNLARIANQGASFSRAYSTAPWTLPSHASMFTGHLPHEMFDAWWQSLGTRFPTLAEILRSNGYQTGGFIANTDWCSRVHGLNRGFTHYEDFPISPGQVALSTAVGSQVSNNERLRALVGYHERLDRKNAEALNQGCLRWLARRDVQRPFFAFLNYFDAHGPYLPPLEYALKFSSKRPRGHLVEGEKLSDAEIAELNDAYDGALAYLDAQIDHLLASLDQQGLLENTLVVITSDHGEQFGEHGLTWHGNSLYLPCVHVPLLVSFPTRVPAGHVVHDPVSLVDLPATVLNLLGLDNASVPGRSLAERWTQATGGPTEGSGPIISEVEQNPHFVDQSPVTRGSIQSIIVGDMHYIHNQGDGREELYDIANDPDELVDLGQTEQGHRHLEEFRATLSMVSGA